jgi:hypothetical protein
MYVAHFAQHKSGSWKSAKKGECRHLRRVQQGGAKNGGSATRNQRLSVSFSQQAATIFDAKA